MQKPQNAPYSIFILILSLFVLVLTGLEGLVPLEDEAQSVLTVIDTMVCGVFLFDFFRSLYRAPNRTRYFFTWGWLDLLSSIPVITELRYGRLARVARILRLLRSFRAARELVRASLRLRVRSAVLGSILACITVVTFASVSILQLEGRNNIKTAEEAIWWSMVTMSTVGYGDFYPTTTEGRVLAMMVMLAGIGLFGTFTGLIASWLMTPAEEEQGADLDQLRVEVAELRAAVQRIEDTLGSQRQPG
ncbi:MAG: ion transporter [Acidobacteriota bacterium]